ncbi:MAG: hypothetical protein WDW38_002016 [Sanguina aurantia]
MFVKATSLTKSSRSAFLGLGRFSSTGAALADDDVYDVVVVGAGMVGAALSSLIGSHPITKNLKIALVDHQQAPTAEWSAPAVPEARVSTITPASISCLAQAGAWNDLCPPHSVAFSSMQHAKRYKPAPAAAMVEPSLTAWQRFLPTGPLALLPVRDGYSNVVWSTTPEMAQELAEMTPSQFANAVNDALNDPSNPTSNIPFCGGGLPEPLRAMLQHPMMGSLDSLFGFGSGYDGRSEFQPPPRVLGWEGAPPGRSRWSHGSPAGEPLVIWNVGSVFELYVRQRFALVGDAAHSIHPMAGQGVNLGFADVECLAAALVMATKTGADIGDERVLQELYQGPRQAANLSMAATLDTLQRVFRVEGSPFALLRSLGMGALNVSGPVKDRIMRYAMGL